MRRTLIIFATLLILAGGGIAIYFLFFANSANLAVTPTGKTGLPAAGWGTTNTSTTDTTDGAPTGSPVTVSARLIEISAGPVVPGMALVDLKANASSTLETIVNFIEQESGNVFSYFTRTNTLTRTNNKTIPGIQSATWLPDGSTAFVRYLSGTDFSTINTYALAATDSKGFFLSQNLSDIVVSSTSLLTLVSGTNGSVGSLAYPDGSHTTTIFTTPLAALRVSFAGKDRYLAFSKPSATISGAAFLVDKTGRFSRIAGPRDGLVALASPSGKWVFVSYVQDGTMRAELVNTATGAALSLPVATIADKCVWAANDAFVYCGIPVSPPGGNVYPDDWYQGAVHFSDRIWKIDVAGRYAQLVLDFSEANKGDLDVESPAINTAGTVLVFVNKNDNSLWSYSL